MKPSKVEMPQDIPFELPSEISQEWLEETFSESAKEQFLNELITSDETLMQKSADAMFLINAFANDTEGYNAVLKRRQALLEMDDKQITRFINTFFGLILATTHKTTLATLAGMLAGFIPSKEIDKKQKIILVGEIIGICTDLELYFLGPLQKNGQWFIMPYVQLSIEDLVRVQRAMYVPPSIDEPKKLKNNRSSAYSYLEGTSLILGGSLKHHDYNISLDVLNTQNKIQLSIDTEFYEAVEETFELDVEKIEETVLKIAERAMRKPRKADYILQEQLQEFNFNMHKYQEEFIVPILMKAGNKFHVSNKVDNRGRIYTQGYHINPQGNSYKKAMISFTKKEKVEIPEGYF